MFLFGRLALHGLVRLPGRAMQGQEEQLIKSRKKFFTAMFKTSSQTLYILTGFVHNFRAHFWQHWWPVLSPHLIQRPSFPLRTNWQFLSLLCSFPCESISGKARKVLPALPSVRSERSNIGCKIVGAPGKCPFVRSLLQDEMKLIWAQPVYRAKLVSFRQAAFPFPSLDP